MQHIEPGSARSKKTLYMVNKILDEKNVDENTKSQIMAECLRKYGQNVEATGAMFHQVWVHILG